MHLIKTFMHIAILHAYVFRAENDIFQKIHFIEQLEKRQPIGHFSPGPADTLVGLCLPPCLLFYLRHDRLGNIEVFAKGTKVFAWVTEVDILSYFCSLKTEGHKNIFPMTLYPVKASPTVAMYVQLDKP